jgi:hypothetical protein
MVDLPPPFMIATVSHVGGAGGKQLQIALKTGEIVLVEDDSTSTGTMEEIVTSVHQCTSEI